MDEFADLYLEDRCKLVLLQIILNRIYNVRRIRTCGKYPLPEKPGWGFSFDPDYLEHARRKD